MKLLRAVLSAAVVGSLLTGCTLFDTLGSQGSDPLPGTDATTEAGGGESSQTPTLDPGTEETGPVETIAEPVEDGGRPERVNVQLELGVPHDILGADGSVVGTVTIIGVQDNASCTNSIADASKYGKFVIATFQVTATEALRDQADEWYGRNFDLSTIDVINPYTGKSLPGGLDYDCLPASERLGTVQPGTSATGKLAYDLSNEQFAIGWFYGHQWFYVPPSVWGGTGG